MHRLTTAILAAAGLLAGAWTASAADLRELKEKALLAVRGDAERVERGRAVAELAALDGADAGKALLECLNALVERTVQIEKDHASALRTYNERYAGFTLNDKTEPGAWETKKRLLAQLETLDERLQSDAFVAQAVVTAIAKLKDAGAVAVFERAVATAPLPQARRVLWGGLLLNPITKPGDLARKALRDEDPIVRLGALEVMALRIDPSLVEPVVKALSESGWPLRRAAIHALAAQNDVRGIPPLVAAMAAEDGALLEDYAHALARLTGANLGTHAEPWKRWLEDHKAELAAKGAKAAAGAKGPVKPVQSPLHYYGVETLSRKVVFIIDISGSMREPIGTETGPVTGVKAEDQAYTGLKIDVAKRILSDAIRKLPKETTFNVVYFNHAVRTFADTMQKASDETKAKACLEIEALEPAGSTWTYGALRRTFEIAASTCTEETFDPCVDTVFLLSDGAPTDDSIDKAQPMEGKQIVDAVAQWNERMKVRIHTIAIDPRIGKGSFVRFMKDLAARNQGIYREIGAK